MHFLFRCSPNPNHHPVADLQISDGAAGVFYDPHELMAEDITRFGFWNFASVEMQVRAANGCGGDPEDDVVCFLEDGIRNVIDPDVVCSVVGQCSHWWPAPAVAYFRDRYAGEAMTVGKVQTNKSDGSHYCFERGDRLAAILESSRTPPGCSAGRMMRCELVIGGEARDWHRLMD